MEKEKDERMHEQGKEILWMMLTEEKKKTILQKIHEQGKEHMLDDVTCFICKKNIGKNRGKHLPAG